MFKEKILGRANMENEKRLPSVERVWEKFYSEQALTENMPEMTMYDYALHNNINYMDDTILIFEGNKISYRDFFTAEFATDNIAKAFKNAGLTKDDIISLCSISIPEAYYTLYGANKIGSAVNPFDPRTSEQSIINYLNETKSKYLVMLDKFFPKIDRVVGKTSVEKVIVITPSDSLPKLKAKLYSLTSEQRKLNRDVYSNNAYVSWQDFVTSGMNFKGAVAAPYEKNRPALIPHTGGTTGEPKGVVLTDDAFNSIVRSYRLSGIEYARYDTYAHIMPPWIAYAINRFHMSMVEGMPVILIPKFTPEELPKLFMKLKPNHYVGVPSHLAPIIESEKLKRQAHKFLKSFAIGGDKINSTLEKAANEYLSYINPNFKVYKGYSLTEKGSATIACGSKFNKEGSAGIPLPQYSMKIVGENDEELTYNEKGQICLTGPSVMLYYINNQEATSQIKRTDANGIEWIYTGDLGYIDEDGFLFVEGRLKRMIIRHDGFKVFPFSIENIITSHYAVASCIVVGVPDTEHSQGEVPIAHIVLKDKFVGLESQIETEINQLCINSTLPEYAIPNNYKFRTNYPLTEIGKINYRELSSEPQKVKTLVRTV